MLFMHGSWGGKPQPSLVTHHLNANEVTLLCAVHTPVECDEPSVALLGWRVAFGDIDAIELGPYGLNLSHPDRLASDHASARSSSCLST
jgi:hypothetical protein